MNSNYPYESAVEASEVGMWPMSFSKRNRLNINYHVRGDEITDWLHQDDFFWIPEAENGEWWLRLHASS